jgi:hypothetical protein
VNYAGNFCAYCLVTLVRRRISRIIYDLIGVGANLSLSIATIAATGEDMVVGAKRIVTVGSEEGSDRSVLVTAIAEICFADLVRDRRPAERLDFGLFEVALVGGDEGVSILVLGTNGRGLIIEHCCSQPQES